MRVISNANQKGGVGKTTTSIHIAAGLAMFHNKQVCIIDSDPQGNASLTLFNGNPKTADRDLSTLLNSDFENFSEIYSNMGRDGFRTRIEGLDIIPSNLKLASFERTAWGKLNNHAILKKFMDDDFLNLYDYVIIDCPPSLSLLTVNALSASTDVLVNISCEYYAIFGVSELHGLIKEIQKDLGHNLQILGGLVTMYDGRTNISDLTIKEVNNLYKDKAFKTYIRKNVDVSNAIALQKTVFEHRHSCNASEDYMALCQEIIERCE